MATGAPILAHGAMSRCAKKFGVSVPAIASLWKHMKVNFTQGILSISPTKKKPRPLLYCREELMEQVKALPHHQRRTIRDMATALGISKSTLHNILRSETAADGTQYLIAHTSSLLPLLTDEHKLARLDYALTKLDIGHGCFSSFLQDVHVDEKWFKLTPNRVRVYLTNDEKENHAVPYRKVIHKSHIPKIMFLAATARPRYDNDGNCVFDGKIGIWPIVSREPARRNSVNRPAGTIITKPLNVNNNIYRQMLMEKVVPAIKSRFPHCRNRTVFIQQDGAGAHISSNDEQFLQELERIRGKSCCLRFYLNSYTNIFVFPFQDFGTSNLLHNRHAHRTSIIWICRFFVHWIGQMQKMLSLQTLMN